MNQRTRVLKRLRRGPLTAAEAALMGVINLPHRIMELRREGWRIDTVVRMRQFGFDDFVTPCATYRLVRR